MGRKSREHKNLRQADEKVDKKIIALYREALKFTQEGPLDKAVDCLNKVLAQSPAFPSAALLLADIYTRLARYDDALSVLRRAIELKPTEELKGHLTEIKQVKKKIEELDSRRFNSEGFLYRAVFPDGEGGYFIDTLGFPGVWDVFIEGEQEVENGAVLRFCKSLSLVWEESCFARNRLDRVIFLNPLMKTANPICFRKRVNKEGEGVLWLEVERHFLTLSPFAQREYLSQIIERELREVPSTAVTEKMVKSSLQQQKEPPAVLLISPGLATDYGITVLYDRLLDNHIKAACSHIRNFKRLPEYITMYGKMKEFNGRSPDIFAISVIDAEIEEVNVIIKQIRKNFSNAFVVIGGPSSQTPEQLAVLVPDFDVLIRGDADEILPEVVSILAKSGDRGQVSEEQVNLFKQLNGGIMVKLPQRIIINNFHITNVPDAYHLPLPRKKKMIYYWQTSRGCPYRCRFCNSWTGKKYRIVTSRYSKNNNNFPPHKQSAIEMKDWLVKRLAMEFDERYTLSQMEEILEKKAKQGEKWQIPGLHGQKIFIVIEDDDFLINRNRIFEFYKEITRLGLQHYFYFSAISSVRTFFKNNKIDKEMVEWLKKCNFKTIDLGGDGLSQAVIDQNQKGFSLDYHLIPLNKYLREQGFFVFNNTIVTSPYTTQSELIESLIFFRVCPYPINVAINFGVMGHIGTKFNNEDIINERFNWQQPAGKDYGHYFIVDNYRVPKKFKEYALNASHIISYADPAVRKAVVLLPEYEPWVFLKKFFSPQDVWQVIERWRSLSHQRPETGALAKSIYEHYNSGCRHINDILDLIKHNMRIMNLSSFIDYYEKLRHNNIKTDPRYRLVRECLKVIEGYERRGEQREVEQRLKDLIKECPWYSYPYKKLIDIYLDNGKYSQAVYYFIKLQEVEPDIYYYFKFFYRFMRLTNCWNIYKEDRIPFHIPHYNTLSPVYYLFALLRELAGTKIKRVVIPNLKVADIELYYDILDRLTVERIRESVQRVSSKINQLLSTGKEVNFFGIPVWIRGEELVIACDNLKENGLRITTTGDEQFLDL